VLRSVVIRPATSRRDRCQLHAVLIIEYIVAIQDKLRYLRSFTTLMVLFVGTGSIYMLPYLSASFYIPMKEAMHIDNTQIGLMVSAMGFSSMVSDIPGG
jgi:hypothetical protein